MKTLNRFIIEKLKITKDSKISKSFYENYLIFVPFNLGYKKENHDYMKENYNKYNILSIGKYSNWDAFLISKYEAIDILNSLPFNKISTYDDIFGALYIFKIPEKYLFKEDFLKDIKNIDVSNVFDIDCIKTAWDHIKNLDELKEFCK